MADVGFIFIAYNLRRLMTLTGTSSLVGLLTFTIDVYRLIKALIIHRASNMINQGTFLLSIRKSAKLKIIPIFDT
jgi:hypothetical protein